jgi:seryl-tRNA synthetase
VDVLRNELKNINVEMNEVEEEDAEIRKRLNSRLVEIDNLKREGVSIHTDNEKLLNEHYRLKGLEDDTIH